MGHGVLGLLLWAFATGVIPVPADGGASPFQSALLVALFGGGGAGGPQPITSPADQQVL